MVGTSISSIPDSETNRNLTAWGNLQVPANYSL
jgi:hypothetical protein